MNEETLIYNTPCSEEILRQINQYEFKRLWENNLTKNNKNLLSGIISILIAIIFFIAEDYGFSGLFAGFGITTCINYASYYSSYRKKKKKFQEIIEKEILNLKANPKDTIWEFTPTNFSFKNYKSEYKFIWQEITYCILDDKYLYITASSFLNFILDKANIDEINLNKTIQYLESKSQFKKI
ncbi:hypothetical protein PFY12_07290 [Chryseobacterium camelliae]|uniref:YcxB-like protein domain-containing protein n=1 Tax=Chryseobacterium camelliae TaxID=1265445 RepID=A0ABY7QQK2_9FLAO|nr:hypothetical protein [Chryseobacterium camelliae]WBV61912.1 hypothetical protein PFY12_07290 [Chryseobacterium camelliae]